MTRRSRKKRLAPTEGMIPRLMPDTVFDAACNGDDDGDDGADDNVVLVPFDIIKGEGTKIRDFTITRIAVWMTIDELEDALAAFVAAGPAHADTARRLREGRDHWYATRKKSA